MENTEKLYLDKEGYEHYLKTIEKLKKKLNTINMGRKDAFDAGAGDGWDSPEFEEIERQERIVLGELGRMYEGLSTIIIVEKHNDLNIIDIGNIISVTLYSSPEDKEEVTFKLVGTDGKLDADLQEVSINSPLGNAVYKKKVGDQSRYTVNGKTIQILIKEKMDLDKTQDEPTRKI